MAQHNEMNRGGPRHSRRNFMRLGIGLAATLFLPGCSPRPTPPLPEPTRTSVADTSRYRKPGPWRLGRASRGDLSPWLIMLGAHIEYGVKEKYRDRFRFYRSTSANWDPDKQIQDIQKLLAEGLDLLLIDPLDHAVVAAGVQQAMDAGVPVICVSSTVQGAPYVTWATTNEEQRGELCADWVCRQIQGGRLLVVQGEPAIGDGRLWLRGVKRGLQTKRGVEAEVLNTFWTSSDAKRAVETALRRSPAVSGLIVNSGAIGQGAITALLERGRQIPPIAGVDDWNGWLRTANEHNIRFLGLSGCANLGLRCVELAIDVLNGTPVPVYVEFPYTVFDETAIPRYYRPDLSDHYWAIHELPESWIQRMFHP